MIVNFPFESAAAAIPFSMLAAWEDVFFYARAQSVSDEMSVSCSERYTRKVHEAERERELTR
jgi:hypothetical protein